MLTDIEHFHFLVVIIVVNLIGHLKLRKEKKRKEKKENKKKHFLSLNLN